MALSLCLATASAFQAPAARVGSARSSVSMMDKAGLEGLAKELNPLIGYFDPLKLGEGEFWGDSNAATIGFLREAEIKHGRVAMAGFVGYIVHANDIRLPWDKVAKSVPTGVSPQALWDSIPEAAKWQIILVVGFLEFWRENAYVLSSDGESHYMRGGKPGYFPTFKELPHPVPFTLFDPFKFSAKASPEKKAKSLLAEINNGRLAMLGLTGLLKTYSGNVMTPFDANFHIIG